MTRYTIFKYIFCITISVLCCQSCYDDKGNYDYVAINEIKVEGLEKKYTIRMGEPITIKPNIVSSIRGGEADYSYEWVWMDAVIDGKTVHEYVWSDLKEWDNHQIGLPNGGYRFYYRVRDNKTGVVWISDFFDIVIDNDISAGFFILSDVENVGRLDFISYYKGEFVPKLDILTNIGTEMPSLENPIGVACYFDWNSPKMGATAAEGRYMTGILTKQGTYRVNPTNFSYDELYDIRKNFTGILPESFYAKNFFYEAGSNDPNVLLLDNNNNLYYTYRQWQTFWTVGVYSNTTSDAARFNLDPKLINISFNGAVMYDLDKRTFAYKGYTSSYATHYTKDIEKEFDGLLFKFTDTGKDLVFIHGRQYESQLSAVVYVILKDPNTNEYFLGSFLYNGTQRFYNKLNLTDLANAKHIAMSYNVGSGNKANEFIYYSTDNKIYLFNMADNSNEVVYTATSGSKISSMKFIKQGDWKDHLMVFTYEEGKPADNCGKLEVLLPRPAYGTLSVAIHDGKKMEWTGFGKVIDAEWKEK